LKGGKRPYVKGLTISLIEYGGGKTKRSGWEKLGKQNFVISEILKKLERKWEKETMRHRMGPRYACAQWDTAPRAYNPGGEGKHHIGKEKITFWDRRHEGVH